MRIRLFLLLLVSALGLAACEPQGTYPITGESCGPDDPVQDLDAANCTVPGGV